MWFWRTLTRSQLLHNAWRLDTYSGLICAMVTAAILSFLFEYIEIIKLKIIKYYWPLEKSFKNSEQNASSVPVRLVSTAFYTCRVMIVYLLMLCVMTMNVWILVTVLLGTSAGYILKRVGKERNRSPNMEIGSNFPGFKPSDDTIAIVRHCEPLVANNREQSLDENESPLEMIKLLDESENKYNHNRLQGPM